MSSKTPPITFNQNFLAHFIRQESPCAALGLSEIQGQEKGFLAIKLESPIADTITEKGFDLGSQLLEIKGVVYLHLILNFSQQYIYDVLLNLNSSVVKKVMNNWEQSFDYFFFVISDTGGLTAFNQVILSAWYNDNYFGVIENANNTIEQYKQAVEIFKNGNALHGTFVDFVLHDDIELSELSEHRLELKSC